MRRPHPASRINEWRLKAKQKRGVMPAATVLVAPRSATHQRGQGAPWMRPARHHHARSGIERMGSRARWRR
jgi:hypothetical protein